MIYYLPKHIFRNWLLAFHHLKKIIMKHFYSTTWWLLLFSLACNPPQKPTVETLKGSFRSTKGVMAPLSCVCYNGGYLSVGKQEIAICFADETDIKCKTIEVSGKYVTKKLGGGGNNPCPTGQMTYLMVDTYKCQ